MKNVILTIIKTRLIACGEKIVVCEVIVNIIYLIIVKKFLANYS